MTSIKKAYENGPFSEETVVLGEELMDKIGEERKRIWQDLIENTDMIHNSKKA